MSTYEWKWVDVVYGEMAWFTSGQRRRLRRRKEFRRGQGWWERVKPEELAQFNESARALVA